MRGGRARLLAASAVKGRGRGRGGRRRGKGGEGIEQKVNLWPFPPLTENGQHFNGRRYPPSTLGRRWEVSRMRWEEADRDEQVDLFHKCLEVVCGVTVFRERRRRGRYHHWPQWSRHSMAFVVTAAPSEPADQVAVVLVGHEGELPQEVGKDNVCVWSPELGILNTWEGEGGREKGM